MMIHSIVIQVKPRSHLQVGSQNRKAHRNNACLILCTQEKERVTPARRTNLNRTRIQLYNSYQFINLLYCNQLQPQIINTFFPNQIQPHRFFPGFFHHQRTIVIHRSQANGPIRRSSAGHIFSNSWSLRTAKWWKSGLTGLVYGFLGFSRVFWGFLELSRVF